MQSILTARQMNADGILSVRGLRGLDQLVLKTADGKILAQAVSDVYGKAVLFYDRKAAGEAVLLSVNGQEEEVQLTVQRLSTSIGVPPILAAIGETELTADP